MQRPTPNHWIHLLIKAMIRIDPVCAVQRLWPSAILRLPVRTRLCATCRLMTLRLVPATASDRERIARIRTPIGMGRFVHFNWFWLDRALADPEIQLSLIRGGSRGGITGCLAYGPHERVDLDPSSRMPGVGEIYHVVIDRKHTGRGQGTRAIVAGIGALRASIPNLNAVRVSHHADNNAAAKLYARTRVRGDWREDRRRDRHPRPVTGALVVCGLCRRAAELPSRCPNVVGS